MASCCGGAGVPSDGLPNAFAAFAPFEVIGTLGVALFFAAYEDVIGLTRPLADMTTGQNRRPWGVLMRLVRLTSLFT